MSTAPVFHFWQPAEPAPAKVGGSRNAARSRRKAPPSSGTHFHNISSPRCVGFCHGARRDEETVARATAPRSNDAPWQNNRNPLGPVRLPQCRRRFELVVSLRIRLRSCSLALRQSVRVAAGDIVEMGSMSRVPGAFSLHSHISTSLTLRLFKTGTLRPIFQLFSNTADPFSGRWKREEDTCWGGLELTVPQNRHLLHKAR